MKSVRIKGVWLAALCAVAGAGCTDGDRESAQVLTGRIGASDAIAIRAVTTDRVVTATPIRSDGSFALALPAGERYRLEVLTANGVKHVLQQQGGSLSGLTFKVCQPVAPFDVGQIHSGGTSNNCDPNTDPMCTPQDPPWPCMDPNDPGCQPPPPPCMDPSDPSCPPPPCMDPSSPNCPPPPPPCDPMTDPYCGGCQPGDPNCDPCPMGQCPPPPCMDPTDPNCPQPCDPMTDPTCGGGCQPGDPNCDPCPMGQCPPPPPPGCMDPTDPSCDCSAYGTCPPTCMDPMDPNCGCFPGDPSCEPPPPCMDPTDPNTCQDPCMGMADPSQCGCSSSDPNCWPPPQPQPCGPNEMCAPGDGMSPENTPIDFGCEGLVGS